MPEVEPNIHPLIWSAIEQKRLLRFHYKNRERIVEPHDYGIHKGIIKLFGYQVAGSSSRKLPTWRWAEQECCSSQCCGYCGGPWDSTLRSSLWAF